MVYGGKQKIKQFLVLSLRPLGKYLTNSGEVHLWPKAGYGSLWFTPGKFLHRPILSFSLEIHSEHVGNPADLPQELLGYLVKRILEHLTLSLGLDAVSGLQEGGEQNVLLDWIHDR